MSRLTKADYCILSIALLFSVNAFGERKYKFDESYVGLEGIDTSVFDNGGQLPGTYVVDIRVNGTLVDVRPVKFSLNEDHDKKKQLAPCLSISDLSRYGVKVENYPELNSRHESDKTNVCVKLSGIPSASFKYTFNNQELAISIPQVAMKEEADLLTYRGSWDDGIPAGLLAYDFNTTRTNYTGAGSSEYNFLQVNPGLNLGAWRLRNSSYWTGATGKPSQWKSNYSYVERSLYDIKSRISFGELYTRGEMFESTKFTGLMIESDEYAIPLNQKRFSPIVSGIAKTNARIEVVQNGYIVHSVMVAPGPFSLENINLNGGSSSTLLVTVYESDGSQQLITVPYTSPAISLCKGCLSYSSIIGHYRSSDENVNTPAVFETTLTYGLPWDLTVYSGLQYTNNFQALTSGFGASLGNLGALSIDATASKGQTNIAGQEVGRAFRVRYNKTLDYTNTGVLFSAQKYSKHYDNLSFFLDDYNDNLSKNSGGVYYGRLASEHSLGLNQSLIGSSYIMLNAYEARFWDNTRATSGFGISYSQSLKNVSLNLNITKNIQKDQLGKRESQLFGNFSASMPLDFMISSSPRGSLALSSFSKRDNTYKLGISGFSYDSGISWSAYNDGGAGRAANTSLNGGWQAPYASLTGGYSFSEDYNQMSGNIGGGLILHSGGFTLSQSLGDTIALIDAGGAKDIPILGMSGVKTNYKGNAVQTHLTPYQVNNISLSPLGIPYDVSLLQTEKKVFPAKGSVVLASFETKTGENALISLLKSNGDPVPFGALVSVNGVIDERAIVGDYGQVYLTGLSDSGELSAVWGKNEKQRCDAKFYLEKRQKKFNVNVFTLFCL